ncbi:kinesin-like protein KIN-6 isoform X3 [Papaver somniferum]|uniref:kinesin-like protein KIN-6 isoform X3 n=1 Tax=Papaver somniferum TaxID=3469 RepID=UPI000E70431A|nr:kinesin-like protein KIN-6 isoform X3 [Papaver somniferum]
MEEEGKDTSPKCPYTITVRRNPPRKAKKTPSTNAPPSSKSTYFKPKDIRPYPIDDILKCDVSQAPTPVPVAPPENLESIRVFLRVRPIDIRKFSTKNSDVAAKGARSKLKGVSPKRDLKKTARKKEVCLCVTDSQSVTLAPPADMQDTRRVKTEVYDGFNHVFDSDSQQKDVYEKVMDPLVCDFIAGKSGMIAAMGPTGSGKTHTVFGSAREPGILPLALRKIFNSSGNNCSSELAGSYYISIFEIYSERGKGEKIVDLSLDGTDLSSQQSTIKCQQVLVTNVAEAESLIARGMLKRTTAMTNSNTQSSRSQCIINIIATQKTFDRKVEIVLNGPVLSIVDLAGAERSQKTGNQGTRLLESNFINNTSMVFAQCLRSLLEHQKNPKKQLQKHFQNSLLTKYLRDYLEGKKRMTLILTVKPGEDDYVDTSHLLRQASPYMKIKFSTVEEPSTLAYPKRAVEKLPRIEQPKRRKLREPDASEIDEAKIVNSEHPILKKERILKQLQQHEPLNVKKDLHKILHSEKACCTELAGTKRREQILLNFSKALWNVLKQYKQKLENSEGENHSLKENLNLERARCLELEKELGLLKLNDSHCTQLVVEDSALGSGAAKIYQEKCTIYKVEVSDECSPVKDLKVEDHQVIMSGISFLGIWVSTMMSVVEDSPLGSVAAEIDNEKSTIFKVQNLEVEVSDERSPVKDLKLEDHQVEVSDECSPVKDLKLEDHQVEVSVECSPVNDLKLEDHQDVEDSPLGSGAAEIDQEKCTIFKVQSLEVVSDERSPVKDLKLEDHQVNSALTQSMNQEFKAFIGKENAGNDIENLKHVDIKDKSPNQDIAGAGLGLSVLLASSPHSKVLSVTALHEETVSETLANNITESEQECCSPLKSVNVQKPRRRLLPASSLLLKELNTLDLEVENEEPKGGRGGKKFTEERIMSKGGVSLLRLLKSNVRS